MGKKSGNEKNAELDLSAKVEKRSTPKTVLACMLAWFLPGAGHFFLQRYIRGAIFSVTILFMFGFGLYLGGKTYPKVKTESEKMMSRGEGLDFLSYFAAFACLGNGPVYFVIRRIPRLRYGQGNVISATYEYGTTFILVAGLLNMLLILDAYDISKGRKP